MFFNRHCFFDIPFMLYDGTIPNACKDAEFTLYDENGDELESKC